MHKKYAIIKVREGDGPHGKASFVSRISQGKDTLPRNKKGRNGETV